MDISQVEPTVSMLLEWDDLLESNRSAEPRKSWKLQDVLDATLRHDAGKAHLLAPIEPRSTCR